MKRLDRLARSTRDLLNTIDAIAKAGAGFKSLHDGWADTTTAHGRLMLTVLGGLAEFEREQILARTSEGRTRAKARGVKMGRGFALTPPSARQARCRRSFTRSPARSTLPIRPLEGLHRRPSAGYARAMRQLHRHMPADYLPAPPGAPSPPPLVFCAPVPNPPRSASKRRASLRKIFAQSQSFRRPRVCRECQVRAAVASMFPGGRKRARKK